MARFKLQVHSALMGDMPHWALYAIACDSDTRLTLAPPRSLADIDRRIAKVLKKEDCCREVERTGCHSVQELDQLLRKLRLLGLSPRVLEMARAELTHANVSRVLGTLELSQAERSFLGLFPVAGLTAADINQTTAFDDPEADEEDRETRNG